jgi:serine/threonine protein kinase
MPTMPLVGDEFAGYRLMGVVGRGGMSVVYRAENPRLGSTVALKVLAPEIATSDLFRTRFLQESRIAASLSHPNVIPIYDMGSHADLLYIAMRYVNGHDMRDLLKAKRPLPPTEALYLVGQCGRALDYAHRHSLVHRDVKPANLLVEAGADDEDPDHVFLADFGITKHALSRTGLTPTGQFMGTLDYVAPEQIQGKEVGKSADIYSLGCVLYEGLTGQVPFVKEIDAAVLWAHVEEPAPAPSSINPVLPARLDAVMARALSKNPGDRYATCHAMVADARDTFAHDEQATATSRPVPSQRPAPVEQAAVLAARRDADHGERPGESLGGPIGPAQRDGAPGVAAVTPPPAAAAGSVSSSGQRTPADAPDGPTPSGSLPLQDLSSVDDTGSAAPAQRPSGPRHRSDQHDRPEPPDQLDQPDQLDEPGGPGAGMPLGGGGSGIGGVPRRAGLVVVASLLVLAVVGGIWYGARQLEQPPEAATTGPQHSASPTGTASSGMSDSMSMSPSPSYNPLAEAIALANTSTGGMLPADRCSATGMDQVACDRPYVGIGQARFRTYPSLKDLYAAYAQRIRGLSDDRLLVNHGDCTRAKISGEVSWNHNFKHPRHYTMAQVASGTLRDDTQAAGRVFCRLRDDVITILWTDNHAKMLGTVTGAPHSLVFRWWKQVHHDLAVGAMTDMGH